MGRTGEGEAIIMIGRKGDGVIGGLKDQDSRVSGNDKSRSSADEETWR